jgi:hypothetical protein
MVARNDGRIIHYIEIFTSVNYDDYESKENFCLECKNLFIHRFLFFYNVIFSLIKI